MEIECVGGGGARGAGRDLEDMTESQRDWKGTWSKTRKANKEEIFKELKMNNENSVV